MKESVIVRRVTAVLDVESCRSIRKKVFIEEQKVSQEEEWDGLDDQSQHTILEVNKIPAGTARVKYSAEKAKIERVAILYEYRGKGFGKKMMEYVIKDIIYSGKVDQIVLGAQNHAIPFYEKMGFMVCGPEYMDGGIAHKDMVMRIVPKKECSFDINSVLIELQSREPIFHHPEKFGKTK